MFQPKLQTPCRRVRFSESALPEVGEDKSRVDLSGKHTALNLDNESTHTVLYNETPAGKGESSFLVKEEEEEKQNKSEQRPTKNNVYKKEEVEEDDDPVIRTIHVYINRISTYAKNEEEDSKTPPKMYLLQYPLRPACRPYGDHGQLVNVKYRSQQDTLLFEYALNTDEAPLGGARTQDGATSKEQDAPQEARHVLTSTSCASPHLSYGIGILRGNRFYITPINGVLQFRPDFTYLDNEDDNDRKRIGNNEDLVTTHVAAKRADPPPVQTTPHPSSKGPTEATSLTSVADSQASSARPNALKSWASPHAMSNTVIPPESEWYRYPASRIRELLLKEPWKPIENFYHPDSCESYELIELLTSFLVPVSSRDDDAKNRGSEINDPALALLDTPMGNTSHLLPVLSSSDNAPGFERVTGGPRLPKLHFSCDFTGYLENLCNVRGLQPGVLLDDIQASGPLSYLQLYRIPCDKQILKILRHVHVETTERIRSLVTQQVPEEDFIAYLQTYADFILGNWVCKSHLVYDGLVAQCRDFLIFLFLSGKTIVRETVRPYMGGLSSTTLTTLLKDLSEYKDNAWHFKFPVNQATIAKYPHLVLQSAEKFSKEAMKNLLAKIQASSVSEQSTVTHSDTQVPFKTSSAPTTSGLSSNAFFNKAIHTALGQHGVQTPVSLLPLVRHYFTQQIETLDASVQAQHTAVLSTVTEDELTNVLPQVAEYIGCNYWTLHKLGNAQVDRYRDILISVLKRMALHPESEESTKGISRSNVFQEFESQNFKWTLPDFMLRKLMREFFVNKNGFWVFKGFVKPTSTQ